MTFQRTFNQIKGGDLHSVYVLFGTEYYFMDQLTHTIKKQIEKQQDGDTTIYHLRETPLQEVMTDVETFPFFSEHKLILAHDPVFLQAKPEKITVEHDTNVLETYLKHPAPYSTLVFIAPYEKLDARKKITKQLKKDAVIVDCNPVKGKEFHAILQQMAKDENIQLTKETSLLLENEYQSNLYMLQKELHKLAAYVGEGNTVSKEIAEQIISPSNTFNALQFVDAVLQKDLAKAIKIYKELEKMKEEPIGLIALLAYQFRIIFQVKLLKEKGYSMDRMKAELKVHPYVVQLATERSKYFSTQMLTHFIYQLTLTDENIKRGKMDQGIAFEMLLYELTGSQ